MRIVGVAASAAILGGAFWLGRVSNEASPAALPAQPAADRVSLPRPRVALRGREVTPAPDTPVADPHARVSPSSTASEPLPPAASDEDARLGPDGTALDTPRAVEAPAPFSMDRSALGFRNLWINRTQEINQSCPLPSDAVAPGQSIQVELALGIAAEGSIEDATVASVQTLGGDGTLSPTEEPAVVSTAECLAGFARSSIRMPEGDARDEIRVSVTHTAS